MPKDYPLPIRSYKGHRGPKKNTARISISGGFGPGRRNLKCPKCKRPATKFYYGCEKNPLGGICQACKEKVRGEKPRQTVQIAVKKSVSGYQPGLADFPGDPSAYVEGPCDLDKKMCQKKREPLTWRDPVPDIQ